MHLFGRRVLHLTLYTNIKFVLFASGAASPQTSTCAFDTQHKGGVIRVAKHMAAESISLPPKRRGLYEYYIRLVTIDIGYLNKGWKLSLPHSTLCLNHTNLPWYQHQYRRCLSFPLMIILFLCPLHQATTHSQSPCCE